MPATEMPRHRKSGAGIWWDANYQLTSAVTTVLRHLRRINHPPKQRIYAIAAYQNPNKKPDGVLSLATV